MPKYWLYSFSLLVAFITLTLVGLSSLTDSRLHIVFCDVGQGDGILIYQKSAQVVIDAGPGNAILKCLSKHLPFWDRNIELAILTNPDRDHYGGFIEVVRRYNVKSFVSPGLNRDDASFKVLADEISKEKAVISAVTDSLDLKIGEIKLDTLWPTQAWLAQETSHLTIQPSDNSPVLGSYFPNDSSSINQSSLVFKLTYGDFDTLLTGDITPPASDVVAPAISGVTEVLKVPHHGSKNGLTESMLKNTNPKLAVISAGKNNRYGHPSPETLKLLEDAGITVLRTDQDGEVEVVTNGKTWEVLGANATKNPFNLDSIREKILNNFKSLLPEPHAALLSGIVLGAKSNLDKDFLEALQKTSTLHIVVASGTNISLVGGAVLAVFAPYFGRRKALILTLVCIAFYTLLVGPQPPIIRAAIMGTISFTALALGRENNALIALFVSALVMLVINPEWISDVSFQLSFLATLGVVVLGTRIAKLPKLPHLPNPPKFLKESFATSLGAQVAVAPILFINFGQVSLIGPFVNLLVLWTIPFIMAGGFVLAIVSLISKTAALPLAWLLWLPLEYFVRVVSAF